MLKVQEASSILRVGFALSNRPHLHRTYLVTVRKQGATAVYPPQTEIYHLSQFDWVRVVSYQTEQKFHFVCCFLLH